VNFLLNVAVTWAQSGHGLTPRCQPSSQGCIWGQIRPPSAFQNFPDLFLDAQSVPTCLQWAKKYLLVLTHLTEKTPTDRQRFSESWQPPPPQFSANCLIALMPRRRVRDSVLLSLESKEKLKPAGCCLWWGCIQKCCSVKQVSPRDGRWIGKDLILHPTNTTDGHWPAVQEGIWKWLRHAFTWRRDSITGGKQGGVKKKEIKRKEMKGRERKGKGRTKERKGKRKGKGTTPDTIQLLGGQADLKSYVRLIGSRSVLWQLISVIKFWSMHSVFIFCFGVFWEGGGRKKIMGSSTQNETKLIGKITPV